MRNQLLEHKYLQEQCHLLEKKVKSLRDEYYGPEKAPMKQLIYISYMLATHPKRYHDKYHNAFIEFCSNLHNLKSMEQLISENYNAIYKNERSWCNKCPHCKGEFKMNDREQIYCSKCKRMKSKIIYNLLIL